MMKKENVFFMIHDEKTEVNVGERGEKHDGTKQAVIRKIAQEE